MRRSTYGGLLPPTQKLTSIDVRKNNIFEITLMKTKKLQCRVYTAIIVKLGHTSVASQLAVGTSNFGHNVGSIIYKVQ
jgi:hypothetical protein